MKCTLLYFWVAYGFMDAQTRDYALYTYEVCKNATLKCFDLVHVTTVCICFSIMNTMNISNYIVIRSWTHDFKIMR